MTTRSRGTAPRTRAPHAPPPSDRAADADLEFLEGSWDEAGPVTLDFDDESSHRELHEREPDEDFAGLRDDPVHRDAADLAELSAGFGDDPGFDDDFDDGGFRH